MSPTGIFWTGGFMVGAEVELEQVSQYTMEIECSQCSEKMFVNIGLNGDPKNNRLECIGCHSEIEPLLPGQIVGGPF
jgi:hypothetical protein